MKRIIGISVLLFTGMFFSCQNEKVDSVQDNVSVEKSAQITLSELNLEAIATASEYEVEFYANAEDMLTRWWKMGKKWGWSDKLRYVTNHCPNVSIVEGNNNGYPKVITLNYGEGTTLKNEKVLSGKIVIEISGPRNSASLTRMVSYENFNIDTVEIKGTSLITIEKGKENFRNYTSDLTFTINGETEIVRSSKRSWTWIKGMETTEDQTDDIIQIDGIVTATSGKDSYKKEITEPLVRMGECRFIVKGIVKITLNNEISTLDYGDGKCDEVATMVNAAGDKVEVDLTKCKRMENKNKNGGGN